MRLSGMFYKAARFTRNAEAVNEAVVTGSPMPIVRRIINYLIARFIVSRLWMK